MLRDLRMEYKYWHQQLSKESWEIIKLSLMENYKFWQNELAVRKQRIARSMGYVGI